MNSLLSYMLSLAVQIKKESTKTYFRRKLGKDFGALLSFEDLLENNRMFIIPETLSKVK